MRAALKVTEPQSEQGASGRLVQLVTATTTRRPQPEPPICRSTWCMDGAVCHKLWPDLKLASEAPSWSWQGFRIVLGAWEQTFCAWQNA